MVYNKDQLEMGGDDGGEWNYCWEAARRQPIVELRLRFSKAIKSLYIFVEEKPSRFFPPRVSRNETNALFHAIYRLQLRFPT